MDPAAAQPLSTARLELTPLSLPQLELCLSDLSALEHQLGLDIARAFFTERLQRALGMKIQKMRAVDISQHAWFTYWLIVIREEKAGAGMVGFKGYPAGGSTEIGYGIAPAYQNHGYMTEAVQALAVWAFAHPFCSVITATEVENPASKRLLEKLGARLVRRSPTSTSWEILKR